MTPLERTALGLERLLGPSTAVTDPALCEGYARDESETDTVTPACVVRARSADDVRATLRLANAHDTPVFARGAGTGRTGGAAVTEPGVVIDTTAMNQVVALSRTEQRVIVEPGLVTATLQALVEAEGLFFPPDPQSAAWSTLGGNVAENAAGPRAYKYGPTRNYVLGLDAVSGDGTLVSHGRMTRKGVTGYDTTALLVGSEGTLAVFTRLTLALTALRPVVTGLWALFGHTHDAARAVTALTARGLDVRCIEFFDGHCCRVIDRADPALGWARTEAALVIECDGGDPEAVARTREAVGALCVEHRAREVLVAESVDEREALWAVRKTMSRALRALRRFKLSEDVVVPVGALEALLDAVAEIAAREGLTMPTYGHAGDGNLHVNLLWDDPAERPAVERAVASLFRATLDLGGTLSGEHGVGVLKAPFLGWEQGDALIALQRGLKAVFDPRGVLNPGKIFARPSHRGC